MSVDDVEQEQDQPPEVKVSIVDRVYNEPTETEDDPWGVRICAILSSLASLPPVVYRYAMKKLTPRWLILRRLRTQQLYNATMVDSLSGRMDLLRVDIQEHIQRDQKTAARVKIAQYNNTRSMHDMAVNAHVNLELSIDFVTNTEIRQSLVRGVKQTRKQEGRIDIDQDQMIAEEEELMEDDADDGDERARHLDSLGLFNEEMQRQTDRVIGGDDMIDQFRERNESNYDDLVKQFNEVPVPGSAPLSSSYIQKFGLLV
jgi:hypothetical protein